jgi:dTDP-4-amino-4,6-dideoxygalactose transaminase
MADPAARHARVGAAVEAAVLQVLRSGRYVGGPVVDEARGRLAASFGWAHGVTTNSGTDALVYALLAVGVGPGDEVIVPAVTFFATAGAVARVGATPVVADVREDLPLLDPARMPLRTRTRAIIAVHLYGEPCLLPDAAVAIVDDLAQCAGATPAPKNGLIGAVSFYPTKTLGAAGDAGLVLTDDAAAARDLLLLTHHGMPEPYVHQRVRGAIGANSRMDAVQAAVLLVHLEDLPARVVLRRAHAAAYDRELPSWVRRLPRHASHPVHQYVVRVPRRDAVRARLAAAGIESALFYPRSLSGQPALAGFPHAPTPVADAFCEEALALPVHECLTPVDLARIVDAIGREAP